MEIIKIPREFNLNFETTNDFLLQVNSVNLKSDDKNVVLDFGDNTWFNAELTTFLGAIITRFKNNNFRVFISEMSNKVELILQKNGFLETYGLASGAKDTYETTIPFFFVRANSIREIDQYLREKVFSKISHLRKEIVSSSSIELMENAVYEVVHNIKEHSDSEYVIMCGQYYPSKEKVVFTIADTGVTLPKKVNDNIERTYSDLECIDWAIKKGNSTKQIQSSGLGLYDISEQLSRSGTLHIISRNGYWMSDKSGFTLKRELNHSFFGTLLNLEFHLDKHNILEDTSEDIVF